MSKTYGSPEFLERLMGGTPFRRVLLSSHAGTGAREKAERLMKSAPAHVGYEVIVNEELWKRPFQVYRLELVLPKVTPAPVPVPKRYQVNKLGFRYYAVRDTHKGRNVQTMCGTADAEARAIAAADELNCA